MVVSARSPRQSRQQGRYNLEKDRRSNRKYEKRSREIEKRLEEEENRLEKEIIPQKYDEPSAHEKNIMNRPDIPATWHQKQQAMTPSRSYNKSNESNETQ